MKCTNNKWLPLEFSRRRDHPPYASKTFVRMNVLDFKKARQSRQQSVRIQSVLCEVAYEHNSCGMKCHCKELANSCVIAVIIVVLLFDQWHIRHNWPLQPISQDY